MDHTGIFDIFTDLRTSVVAYESTEDISTPRFHSGIEIHCVTAGETVAVLGDTEWTVSAGQVYLVSPLEHHSRFAVTPFKDTVCVIPSAILASVIGNDNSFSFSSTVIDGTDAEACYRLVGQTLDGLQKGYDRYADASGKALAAWLIDAVGLKDSPVDSSAKTLKGILCYIQQRFSEDISIADAALHFGYSPSRFSHLFTSLVGCSFTQYLKKVRCANADEMLKQGNVSISQVAAACGYPNLSTFYKAYKSVIGTTPKVNQHQRTEDFRMRIMALGNGTELHIHDDHFSVYTEGFRLLDLFVESAVNKPDESDLDKEIHLIEINNSSVRWKAVSRLWEEKLYLLKKTKTGFLFSVSVSGSGAVQSIDYFCGTRSFDQKRESALLSGENEKPPIHCIGSHYAFSGYSQVNVHFTDRVRACHLMQDVPAVLKPYHTGSLPFVFPLFTDWSDVWHGIGLVAKKGEHNFDCFTLNAPANGWEENGCWFSVDFGGKTVVTDSWTSPCIWYDTGKDDMDILNKYALWQYENLGFARNPAKNAVPAWWKGPIFCGWSAQGDLQNKKPRPGGEKDYADEKSYRLFNSMLKERNLEPSIIVIDDKWQKEYGTLEPDPEKWPDLRKFADEMHADGKHVILWFRCWHPEGLPADECITVNGMPMFADPTNPKYLSRLKDAIHHLLSEEKGCCNCDGFKLDFIDKYPKDNRFEAFEPGVYGLELGKKLMEAICAFAKAVKPDALMNMTHLHPYLAELCDQYRIHDFHTNQRGTRATMEYRAECAKALMPGVLVDMDGFWCVTKREQLHMLKYNAKLGVPALYRFYSGFNQEDWEQVKAWWDEYKATETDAHKNE